MFPDLKDPGQGNLNLRAFFASVMGPYRTVSGRRSVRRVTGGSSEEVVKNEAPGGVEAIYVEIWLPNSLQAAGRRILFSSSEGMGEIGDYVVLGAIIPGVQSVDRYHAVLLPGEQLFAQVLSDAAGNPVIGQTSLIVSKVTF